MTRSDDFDPVALKLRTNGAEAAVVAEDASGTFQGIVIDPDTVPEFKRLLSIEPKRLLDYWRTYNAERGGNYLLWDLSRLCKAILRCPDVSSLRTLTKFSTAYEVMHSAYQAELMVKAHSQYPGRVRLPPARTSLKRGDFEIVGEPHRLFELKTIYRIATVKSHPSGFRLGQKYADFLPRALRVRELEAAQQVGPDGTCIAVLWCDSAGGIVRQVLAEHEVALEDVFAPRAVVLGLRDETGSDRWFRFDKQSWSIALDLLSSSLSIATCRSINMMGSFKAVTNSQKWADMGRVISMEG